MKPYQDKVTLKWKWGTRGEAIYDSAEQCSRAGMDILTTRLRELNKRLKKTINNHGK